MVAAVDQGGFELLPGGAIVALTKMLVALPDEALGERSAHRGGLFLTFVEDAGEGVVVKLGLQREVRIFDQNVSDRDHGVFIASQKVLEIRHGHQHAGPLALTLQPVRQLAVELDGTFQIVFSK